MKITYADFIAVCPAALAPDSDLFERMHASITSASKKAAGILGPKLYKKISAVETSMDLIPESREETLAQTVITHICARAFYDSIPQLDLVATPNGFGVVSNQNVAPASSDRVANLRNALKDIYERAYFQMISEARSFPEWTETEFASMVFMSFFWCPEHLRLLGIYNPTAKDLDEQRPEILRTEALLPRLLSQAFLDELHEADKKASLTPLQNSALHLIRVLIAAAIRNEPEKYRHRDILLDFLDNNIESFKTYRESSAYEANHAKPYENEKDDPCFFFG